MKGGKWDRKDQIIYKRKRVERKKEKRQQEKEIHGIQEEERRNELTVIKEKGRGNRN